MIKNKIDNYHTSPLQPPRYIRAYTIELLMGFLAIELIITLIFKERIGYVISRYNIFPIILAMMIGIMNLIRAFLSFMNKRILMIQLIDIVYLIYIVGIYWGNNWGWFQILWFFLPLIINPILELVMWFLPLFRHESRLWDYRLYLQKYIPTWIHALLFILCLLETALQYRGYSVLVWV